MLKEYFYARLLWGWIDSVIWGVSKMSEDWFMLPCERCGRKNYLFGGGSVEGIWGFIESTSWKLFKMAANVYVEYTFFSKSRNIWQKLLLRLLYLCGEACQIIVME